MKTVKAELSKDFNTIELHTFSDWHIGDALCNMDFIYDEINAVKDKENAFCILNGDLINNATKASVSDSYAEQLTPNEQIEMLCRLPEPIKDKILMITLGNHEARTYKADGIDLMAIVASKLNRLQRYCSEGGLLFLRFGTAAKTHGRNGSTTLYTIYATHGTGGGRKAGAKANRLEDMASIVDADIYIHSHTHLPMIMKQGFYRTSPSNSSVSFVEKLFVNSSAALEYGSYGQNYEFRPASTANPVIVMDGTKRKMIARV